MPLIRKIFQVGGQSSLNFPCISIVMDDIVILLLDYIKSYMLKPKPHAYCMKKNLNSLLERNFVIRKVYPCLFMYKTFICVVYLYDCLFWAHSKSDIDNVMKTFKEDGPS